jgi:hypothetical protein
MTVVDITGPDPEPGQTRAGGRKTVRLGHIANSVFRTWKIPALVGIIALVLLSAAILILHFVVPTTTTYIARFQFVFPGIDNGKYPSGLPFAINEIIDPVILSKIYDQYHLEEYNIDRAIFYHSFSIRPYTPTEQEMADRFRAELADRRLTFSERENVENQLKRTIETSSRTAAEVTFTMRRRLGIPDEIGRSVVNAVPLVWSQIAIEEKGVLQIPGGSGSAYLISPNVLDRSPLPVAIVMLTDANERLLTRIAALKGTPGINTLRDLKTGNTLSDISREVDDLKVLHINLMHQMLRRYRFKEGLDTTQHIAERRIQNLEDLQAETGKKASVIGEALSSYVNAIVGLKVRMPEKPGSSGSDQGIQSGTVIPQLSEGFLDRIMEMSRQLSSQQSSGGQTPDQMVITDLTRQQLTIKEDLASQRTEQERWKELLDAVQSNSPAKEELDEATQTRLLAELGNTLAEVNQHWSSLNQLQDEFAANRISQTGRLYRDYAVARDVIGSNPVWNLTFVMFAFALVIFLVLFFWAFMIFVDYLQSNKIRGASG